MLRPEFDPERRLCDPPAPKSFTYFAAPPESLFEHVSRNPGPYRVFVDGYVVALATFREDEAFDFQPVPLLWEGDQA